APTPPGLPTPAEAGFPAGHNLFGYGHITDLQAVLVARAFAQCHDFADKFMAGNYRRLAVTGAQFITPEQRRPLITLEIAGADTDRLHPHDHFFRAGFRHIPFLYAIVFRAITDHRLHGFRKGFTRFVRHSVSLL